MKTVLALALAATFAGCVSVPQSSEFYNELLANHTSQIIGVPQPSLIPAGFSVFETEDEGVRLKINGHPLVDSVSLYYSAGVPITEDGYFLTAHHCVDAEESWIQYTGSSESTAELSTQLARIRVVHKNEAGDFAVVKAPFQTPTFLPVTNSLSLRKKEVYVGYSPDNSGWTEGSRIISLSRVLSDGHIYNDFRVSGVAKEGDSGSPVVDRKGKVIGVLVKSTETSTVCRMMDPVALRKIIQEDRDNHQIHSTPDSRSATATRE